MKLSNKNLSLLQRINASSRLEERDAKIQTNDTIDADMASTLVGVPQSLLDDMGFLSDLCTRLWRVDNRLSEMLEKRQDDAEFARLHRRFGEITESLHNNGYEILDPIGQKYDPGLNLRVIQYEPREDLSEETIIETIKPTLRLKGLLIPGEIIVGTPVAELQTVPPVLPTNLQEENKKENVHEPQHD